MDLRPIEIYLIADMGPVREWAERVRALADELEKEIENPPAVEIEVRTSGGNQE